MKRRVIPVRPNWNTINEELGFDFNTIDSVDYWQDGVGYEFTLKQVLQLEKATNDLHSMYLEVLQNLIRNGDLGRLRISKEYIPAIERSWKRRDPSIYGRFDFSYDGVHSPKLLEYNADTPTSLLESAVIQWHWMNDQYKLGNIPHNDQFNSIHEKLILAWKKYATLMKKSETLRFAYIGFSHEDFRTVEYLMDVASQAGIANLDLVKVEDIGCDGEYLADSNNIIINNLFKLYPYEWMMQEDFGHILKKETCRCIEPLWKAMFSNKAFMVLLWEQFPKHPNLLPTYLNSEHLGKNYVRKPIFGREGGNIIIATEKGSVSTDGKYGEEGYIYQAVSMLSKFDDNYAQIGSWIVDGESAGICVREDSNPIITNTSRFVPHYFY
ncbi:MAG: glutathionylspermidine synthase family protein [Oligoflexia bacterium]|nr:glutathionylspermidine synthase family protein [Oligoflexia bacterium]